MHSGKAAAMPPGRNEATLSFCQGSRSMRTTTAILVSNCMLSPVVSQFEILAAVRRRPSPEVSGATASGEAAIVSRKAAPRTRYGPLQDVPRRVGVAVGLHLTMRASYGY